MPESKKRKQPKQRPGRAQPRKPLFPKLSAEDFDTPSTEKRASRDPAREIPEADRVPLPELPEPATYDQVLVALSETDPLSQEVMIAQRLAAMPSQRDGSMPVPIPRMVRPAWAHNLRKLGIFCIPELATHELVSPDATGAMMNHTAMTMKKLGTGDIWEIARQQNPEVAELVDNAHTEEERKEAMQVLAAKLPVGHRIALDKLMSTTPEELEPR